MTLDELRMALLRIPATGAINRARRLAIIKLINNIMANSSGE